MPTLVATLALAAGFALLPVGAARRPVAPRDLYELDRGHTRIGFAVKHFALTTVRGHFAKFTGTVRYDAAAPERTRVDVTIDAASLETDNAERDAALRGPTFLDVAKYPTITFRSDTVARRGAELVTIGDLTIHGTTRRVELPLAFVPPVKAPHNRGKLTLGAEGALTIDRKAYGVNFHKVMDNGSLFVADEVRIEISAQAIHAGPAPAD